MRLSTPRAVSWIGFAAMASIVAVTAVTGSGHVVRLQERELLLHGLDHNRRVAEEVLGALASRPTGPTSADRLTAEVQQVLLTYRNPERYAVFLIDPRRGTVLAHSDPGVSARPVPVSDLLVALHSLEDIPDAPDHDPWQGGKRALTAAGRPAVVYFTPLAATGLVLAVQSDVTSLVEAGRVLRDRVRLVVLAMGASITVIGFLAMRRIGRAYEQVLEQRLAQRTDELQAAQHELVDATRLAAIGQTASTLAHEIRNPLATIKLSLSGVLDAGQAEERVSRRLEIALREVVRLEALLTDSLSIARPISLAPQPVALDGLLDRVLAALEPVLQRGNLRMERHRCAACPSLRVDPAQIEQALFNLVKNAVEASPPGGTIRVAVAPADDGAAVTVENDGPPIPDHLQARVFEPFFTTKPRGAGLGLALVKHVVDQHHGRVRLESGPSPLTRVRMELPCSPFGTHETGKLSPPGCAGDSR